MKNKIYIHTENEEYGNFSDLKNGLVSWSDDINSDSDLKFISADFILARITMLEKLMSLTNTYQNQYTDAYARISELKNLIK